MAVKTYRKKPVVIEAVQWNGTNVLEVYSFMHGSPTLDSAAARDRWDDFSGHYYRKDWHIKTLEDGANGEAKHVASVGDWIIKGVKGEFYPCKPDIFDITYEPAENPTPKPQMGAEPTIGELLNQYFDQGRTGKHGEKANSIRAAIAAELQKIRAEADDETYEIGKRDGYSDAVQQIDQLTGGDGEYRYCLGMEDSDRHTPGPAEMIQRIVDRFEVLNLLDDATKTGRDQPDDGPTPKPQTVGEP